MGMDVTTSYLDENGQPQQIDTHALADDMNNAGYKVTNSSPDGQMLTMQDAKGQFNIHVHDVLKNMGYKVQGSMPKEQDIDYKNISLPNRALITELPDDDAKKAFIESKAKRNGIDDPKVIGQGRDWFYFDKDAGKYMAVTNHPGWQNLGTTDLGEAIPSVIHGAGAVLGGLGAGALASETGPGAIPAAMAGAGAGGMAAEAAMRGGMAAYDPDYANTLSLAEQAKEVGLSGIPDVALAGGGGLLAKGAAKLITPGAGQAVAKLVQGPVSRMSQAVGEGVAGIGNLVGGGSGKIAESQFLQEAIGSQIPGLSQAQMASFLGRIPKALITSGPQAVKWLSEQPWFVKAVGPDAAQGLGSKAVAMLENIPSSEEARAVLAPDRISKLQDIVRKGYQKIGLEQAQPETAQARNVMANAGRMAGQGVRDMFGSEELSSLSPEMAKKVVNLPGSTEALGAQIGKGSETLARAAEAVDSGVRGTVKGMARLGQGAGNTAYYAGKGLSTAGQIARPFESAITSQAAAKQYLNPELRKDLPFLSEENARRKRLQAQPGMQTAQQEPVDFSSEPDYAAMLR